MLTEQKRKWKGRKTYEIKGDFLEAYSQVPTFSRENFELDEGGENEYMDVIINDKTAVPVATVSKGYSLVQHNQVLQTIDQAFQRLNFSTKNIQTNIRMSEYGERMWVSVDFPEDKNFTPNDGHPVHLQFHSINSVDGSARLSFQFGWLRLVCSNGLFSLVDCGTFAKKHTASLEEKNLSEYLQRATDISSFETQHYEELTNERLELNKDYVEAWITQTVNKKWGVRLAARVYNILKTGFDGKPDRSQEKEKGLRNFPHQISVSNETDVPGQPPAETIYDAANALSYISSHQDTLQTRYEQMTQVPELIRDLRQRRLHNQTLNNLR